MTTTPTPYVGPRSYQIGERLYGRDGEVEQLLDLLIASRVVLLYSPSGAGKTSLVQAGLIPRLVQEHFTVAPIIRVDRPPTARASDGGPGPDRYLESALGCLEDGRAEGERLSPEELSGLGLAAYLERLGSDQDRVIVLDQFETLLTTDPADRAAKEAFLSEVAAAIRDPRQWVLIVLREEFLAALDPYLHLLPTRLAARMRLELLDEERARDAIQQPAAAAGVTITDDAANHLIAGLRRVIGDDEHGAPESTLGPTVEPVQLQVVCLRIWQELQPEEGATIGPGDLPATAGVDDALADYYATSVARIAAETQTPEIEIREWFERQLIAQHAGRSVRAQVRDGIPATVRAACEDAYLIRGDERSGVRWYELAHDRLILPVRTSNALWLRANASPFQLRARAWADSLRSPSMLLRGNDLSEGRRWVAGRTLSDVEQDFLDQSEAARRQDRKIRMLARTNVALVVGLIAGVGLIALLIAIQARLEDQQHVTQLRSDAADLLDRRPDVAMRLAREAYLISGDQHDTAVLDATLCCPTQLSTVVTSAEGPVTGVAFDPAGHRLIAVHEDGSVHLRDLDKGDDSRRTIVDGPLDGPLCRPVSGSPASPPAGSPAGPPASLLSAFAVAWQPNPDGVVAIGDGEGDLWFIDHDWCTAHRVTRPDDRDTDSLRITSLQFSDDGQSLVSGRGDGTVEAWAAPFTMDSRPTQLYQPDPADAAEHDDSVADLAISRDGRLLAVALGTDKRLLLLDLTRPGSPGAFLKAEQAVTAVEITDEADPRVIVGLRGRLRMVDVTPVFLPELPWIPSWDGDALLLPGRAGDQVRDIALGPATREGPRIAIGQDGGALTIQRLLLGPDSSGATLRPDSQILRVSDQAIEQVAWNPDGTEVVAGDQGGALLVWAGVEPRQTISRHSSAVEALRITPGGTVHALFADGSLDVDGRVTTVAPAPSLAVTAAAIAEDGTAIALGRETGGIVVRMGDDPARFLQPDASAAPSPPPGTTTEPTALKIDALAFDPAHTRLASASDGGAVRIWDLTDPTASRSVDGEVGAGSAPLAAFTPDGKHLIVTLCRKVLGTTCDESQIVWVDALTGERKGESTPVLGYITSLAVDPFNPENVAIGTKRGAVVLYRFDSGRGIAEPLRRIKLADKIFALTFGGSGPARLAAGTESGVVRLLDPTNLTVVVDGVSRSRGQISEIAFSADGGSLVVGGDDGILETVALTPAHAADRACELTGSLTPRGLASFMPDHVAPHPCPTATPGGS